MQKKYLHEYTLRELLFEEKEPDLHDVEFMTAVEELRTVGLSHKWVWKYYADSMETVTTMELIKDLEACEKVMAHIMQGEAWAKNLTFIGTLGVGYVLDKLSLIPSIPIDSIKAKVELFSQFPAVIDLKETLFDDVEPLDLLHLFGLDDNVVSLVKGSDKDLREHDVSGSAQCLISSSQHQYSSAARLQNVRP